MEKNLKVFSALHDGVWLGGISVVVAVSAEAAVELLNAELVKRGLKPDAQVYEINLSKPSAEVLFDGDY